MVRDKLETAEIYEATRRALRSLFVNMFRTVRTDREKAVADALAMVDVALQPVIEANLRRIIDCFPKHYGVHRQSRFWRVLFRYFQREEAMEAYLDQFPVVITTRQRMAIAGELAKRFQCSESEIQEKTKFFVVRCEGPRRSEATEPTRENSPYFEGRLPW